MKDKQIVFLIAIALSLLGVVMVFSSTSFYCETEKVGSFFYLKKEIIWMSIGMLLLFLSYNVNLKFLKVLSPYLFMITIISVALTYTPLGVKVGGAQRWIRFAGINFQPSEFLKFGVACMLSYYLSGEIRIKQKTFKDFLTCLFFIGIAAMLVLGQPDFGTSTLICMVGVSIMFIAGIKLKYLLSLFLSSIPFIYICIVKFPYRLRRVIAFLDPWADPQGNCFQIVQSFLAIGRGNFFGVGLGASTQKLYYLPAAHTDFIFSILAEELGFIGCVCVIFLFMLLSFFAVKIAMKSKDLYSYLLTLSCTLYISLQAIFNVAVVTGSVPTKGIALPFISFGGSSLALNLLAIGLIMNVARQNEMVKEKKNKVINSRTQNNVYSRDSRLGLLNI